ncbi:hypothetical protein [Endozoicomonas euniceicola]|uniref:Uncharacterized protein n=1 Tax=Endozoicomonas euniceicola TaxID=1234143 RepID=A0ABY6GSS5_9GAMM|nr:hypothetical protein [Endozoicomonas euniceicola]UYM15750.1 hypothetical protein NX720_23465 [Endozoicomonas euniceicola]
MKTLAGMLLMLVFFLHGGQAKGVESHYIDKFIDAGGNHGKPDYIRLGATRINLQPGTTPDDDRVELTDEFNPSSGLAYFEYQRIIDLFYGVTELAADTGTATTPGERNSALAMLSVISRLFMLNRDLQIKSNNLFVIVASTQKAYEKYKNYKDYIDSMYSYVVKHSKTQKDLFELAFHGFWLHQYNALNLPVHRANLTVSFGNFIQYGINERASPQSTKVNFNEHFGKLHSDEGIVEFLREQNVATTFALAVGLNALLEASPLDQSEERTIEQILGESRVLPLAQQTVVALLNRPSVNDYARPSSNPPSETAPLYSLLSPDAFPSTLGSLYRNYRQSTIHKIPTNRIPSLFFFAVGTSSAQNSISSQELNKLVNNQIFGTDLYTATCDSTYTPTSEANPVITREELNIISNNLNNYLQSLGSDTVNPDQIDHIRESIMTELECVNRLEPCGFTYPGSGRAYTNQAKAFRDMFIQPKPDQPPAAETLLLRGLFRGYFETFSTALQRLADGDRESPEVRALIVLLNIIIETETGYSAPPSPADQLNKRQPPSGGAGASLAAP